MNARAAVLPLAAPIGIAAEVDELGRIEAQLAPLKPALKRQKELKEILAGYDQPVMLGDEFVCTVTTSLEDRLDTPTIRTEMGADWCLAYTKTLVKKTVRTAPQRTAPHPT